MIKSMPRLVAAAMLGASTTACSSGGAPADAGSEFDEGSQGDGALDVPGLVATCNELAEYLAAYAATHRSCTTADQCEAAIADSGPWGCRFCYLVYDGFPELEGTVPILRSDDVTPEFAAVRSRFDAECRFALPSGAWVCMFDTRGETRIECRSGQCFGVAVPTTGCPWGDGGGDAGDAADVPDVPDVADVADAPDAKRAVFIVFASEPTELDSYLLLANSAVDVAYRSPSPHPADQDEFEAQGRPYFFTAASSDFSNYLGEPLYVDTATIDTVAARPQCRGFYLHEVLTLGASEHSWDWASALAGFDWTWMEHVVAAAP